MDTATKVALFGFLGTVVTSILGAVVAWLVNRKEKRQTAENTLKAAYEQRLIFKDEVIAERDLDIVQLKLDKEELEAENDKLRLEREAGRKE